MGIGERRSGLDVATLRVGIAGRKGAIFGRRLVDDADGRDFSVNQGYFLLDEALLVDPTEHGIGDSKRRVLRVNEKDFLSNELLALRYVKFRARGFTGTDETCELMKEHAEKTWPKMVAEGNRFAGNFLRIIPGDITERTQLEAYVEKIRTVMVEDGTEALFERYVRPAVPDMAAQLAARRSS